MLEPTAETPLLSPVQLEPKSLSIGSSHAPSTGDHDLHFYNPDTILDVSREVAFAYLILLTGGAVEYVAPTALVELEGAVVLATTSSSAQQQQQPQSINNSESPTYPSHSRTGQGDSSKITTTNLNDESASLAYAAIVDGNVLHACFGLRSTPNGRVCNNSVFPKSMGVDIHGGDGTIPPSRSSYSLFCCFPIGGGASSPTLDAINLLLFNLSSSRTKMQHLVEILREVREMHLESSLGGSGGNSVCSGGALYTLNRITKAPLYLQVIHAYIHCFTSIVQYHDAKEIIFCCDSSVSAPNSHGVSNTKRRKERKSTSILIWYEFIKKIDIMSKKTKSTDPKLEQLRIDTLNDIGKGFHGLKEDIWESLERMATETSFTGCASLEESTLGESSISKFNRGGNELP